MQCKYSANAASAEKFRFVVNGNKFSVWVGGRYCSLSPTFQITCDSDTAVEFEKMENSNGPLAVKCVNTKFAKITSAKIICNGEQNEAEQFQFVQ